MDSRTSIIIIIFFIVFINQIFIILAMCLLPLSDLLVGVGNIVLVITTALILTTSLIIVCVLVSVMFVSSIVMLAISFSLFIAIVSYLSPSSTRSKQAKILTKLA